MWLSRLVYPNRMGNGRVEHAHTRPMYSICWCEIWHTRWCAVESLQRTNKINEQRDFRVSVHVDVDDALFYYLFLPFVCVCVPLSLRRRAYIWIFELLKLDMIIIITIMYLWCVFRFASLVVWCCAQHREFICLEISLFSSSSSPSSSSSFQASQWQPRHCLLFPFPCFTVTPSAFLSDKMA